MPLHWDNTVKKEIVECAFPAELKFRPGDIVRVPGREAKGLKSGSTIGSDIGAPKGLVADMTTDRALALFAFFDNSFPPLLGRLIPRKIIC